ncbi:uncharacterized protein LOC124643749 isoform X3 [Helicoverpa zea]|uniref:uncharacterized protein LOC124643749 isoform X3 n=1 Tax=Helicoverpa zea TaxID=7113 RepID=UPI001F55C5B3|nr:uncharacterized protein LOC124643749 isoform X3 [Helicoverpa zea]
MVFKNHETVTFVVIMSWFVMTIEMSTVYKHFNIYKTEYYDDEDTFSKDILLVETYSIKGKLKTKKTKIDIFLKIGKKKYCTWRLFDGTRTKGKKCHMECGLRTCTYNKPCLVEITLSDDCLDDKRKDLLIYTSTDSFRETYTSITTNKYSLDDDTTEITDISMNHTDSDKSGGRHKYHSISRKDALAYGIGGFVVVCAALLVYVCVRRYRNKPDAQQTMELNTYATTNPVLYADLEMARGGNRTPVRAEESPYAEIIGVLKPKENVETN